MVINRSDLFGKYQYNKLTEGWGQLNYKKVSSVSFFLNYNKENGVIRSHQDIFSGKTNLCCKKFQIYIK